MNKDTKHTFNSLAIEITRKCNKKCSHCMRGEAQEITITKEIIDSLFSNVEDCNIIHLTGGEPLLAIPEIEYLINSIIKNKWTTKEINIVTNGSIISERIIHTFTNFCNSGSDKKITFSITNDQYHDETDYETAYEYYKTNCIHKNIIVERYAEFEINNFINYSGNAVKLIKQHGNNHTMNELPPLIKVQYLHSHQIRIKNNIVYCRLEISANGNVNTLEDVSYRTSDKRCLGNILNDSLYTIIQNNNKSSLLSCRDYREMELIKNSLGYTHLMNFSLPDTYYIGGILGDYVYTQLLNVRKIAKSIFSHVPVKEIIRCIEMPERFITFIALYPNRIYKIFFNSTKEININQYLKMFDIFDNKEYLSKLYIQHLKMSYTDNYINDLELKSLFALGIYQNGAMFKDDKIKGLYQHLCTNIPYFELITTDNLLNTSVFQKLLFLNEKYKNNEIVFDDSYNTPCDMEKTIYEQFIDSML